MSNRAKQMLSLLLALTIISSMASPAFALNESSKGDGSGAPGVEAVPDNDNKKDEGTGKDNTGDNGVGGNPVTGENTGNEGGTPGNTENGGTGTPGAGTDGNNPGTGTPGSGSDGSESKPGGSESKPGGSESKPGTGGDENEGNKPVNKDLGEVAVAIKVGSNNDIGILVSNYVASKFELDDKAEIKYTGKFSSKANQTGTSDLTYTYENGDVYTAKVSWTVVEPESYSIKDKIDTIKASDKINSSESTLLSYVNSDLTAIPHGSEYEAAVGNGLTYKIPKFTWDMCDNKYEAFGGVKYTFTITYSGSVLTREVTVDSIDYSTPNIRIDYDTNKFVGTNSNMVYSVDKNKWNKCSDNMDIPKNLYDQKVYFKYPATKYSPESGICTLQVPAKANVPDTALELSATSHSVIITNCWDFDQVEYSIDGTNYYTTNKETYTFNGLKPKTGYKVYVRAQADPGRLLSSEAKTYSITTEEKAETFIKVEYTDTKGKGNVLGIGTVASDINGNTLVGSYDSGTLSRFKSVVDGMITKCDSVISKLTIEHYIEDNETSDINAVRFSMPLNGLQKAIKNAGMSILYECDYMKVELDNSTLRSMNNSSSSGNLSIEIKRIDTIPNTSALKWLRAESDLGRPIYDISVRAGSKSTDAKFIIPYELKKNETIPGVSVYYVDNKGNQIDLMADYNFEAKCFEFETDKSGYVAIIKDSEAEVMPFIDIPVDFWAYNSIKYCYNRGIFAGVSKYEFAPQRAITRGMIYTLVARMGDADLDKTLAKSSFGDVKLDDWYCNAAHWALQNKLVSGKAFDGEGTMTRGEITEVLYKFMLMQGYKDDKDAANRCKELYTDMDKVNGNVRKAAVFMYDNGIMIGVGNKLFNPDSDVTRAQMATILYRLNLLLEK